MPSSRAQICGHRRRVPVGDARTPGCTAARPVDEQAHRLVPASAPRRRRRARVGGPGSGQRGHAPGGLAGDAQRLPAGGQDAQRAGRPAAGRRPAGRRRPAGARSCPAPAAGAGRAGRRRAWPAAGRPGSSRTPTAAATAWGTSAGSASGRQLDQPHPVRVRVQRRRPRPAGPGGSCPSRRGRSGSPAGGRPAAPPPPPAPAPGPTKLVSCRGRLCGQRVQACAGAGSRRAGPGAASWNTRSGRWQVLQPVLPQVAQAGPRRQGVPHQRRRRPRRAPPAPRGPWPSAGRSGTAGAPK